MHFIKLGFMGSYKVDLLHYFSSILRVMNKKVLVIDASLEQFLKVTLPVEGEMTEVTSKGIDFMVEQQAIESLDQMDYSGYDIALIDYGFNKRVAFDFSSCHLLFVITDFQKHHVLLLKELIQSSFADQVNVVKIFRDVISTKMNATYINRLLNIPDGVDVLAEYVFPLTEEDLECRLLCQYEDIYKFNKLSKAYKSLFVDIIEELYGLKQADIIKAIKLAEGGKVCK